MLPRDVFPHQSGNGLGVVRLRFYGSASFFPSSAWSIYVDEPFRRKIMNYQMTTSQLQSAPSELDDCTADGNPVPVRIEIPLASPNNIGDGLRQFSDIVGVFC